MVTRRDATITFFPVGNGDTSLITLSDGSSIVIDVNVTVDSKEARSTLTTSTRTCSGRVGAMPPALLIWTPSS